MLFKKQNKNIGMNYIVLDTETTGTPKSYNLAHIKDLSNYPFCIQVAWQTYTGLGTKISSFDSLIKPYGWTIPTTEFHLKNGFKTEINDAQGIPIGDALDCFIKEVNRFEGDVTIVCHNVKFDFGVIATEMLREGIRRNLSNINLLQEWIPSKQLTDMGLKCNHKVPKFCTMEFGMNLMKIPKTPDQTYAGSPKYKFPKLAELYHFMFNEELSDAHQANGDVTSTARIFFELKRQGLIDNV